MGVWIIAEKKHALEFFKYLDVSSNSGPSFFGKVIKFYILTSSFCLKIQTKKRNSVKIAEMLT